MIPSTTIYNFIKWQEKIDHFMYKDDIKIFAMDKKKELEITMLKK